MRCRSLFPAGVTAALLAAAGSHATAGETWQGKVVGVSDGDTLTVLHDKTPVKIRLHGVDAPEEAQPFGEKAKQFTSHLVFGKGVRVEVVTRDNYGRTVAVVYYKPVMRVWGKGGLADHPHERLGPERSLNEELLRAGLAWWYRQYAPKNKKLAQLEEEAKKAKRGLWADANPTPPWEWRQAKRGQATATCKEDSDCILRLCCCNWRALVKVAPAPAICARRCRCKFPPKPQGVRCEHGRCEVVHKGQATGVSTKLPDGSVKPIGGWRAFRGNSKSKVLHAPGCRDYACKSCTAAFKSLDDAKRAGYRPHDACVGQFEKCYSGCLKQNGARAVAWEMVEADCRRSCGGHR